MLDISKVEGMASVYDFDAIVHEIDGGTILVEDVVPYVVETFFKNARNIYKRPIKALARRDKFLENVITLAYNHGLLDEAKSLHEQYTCVLEVEKLYQDILSTLEKCEISRHKSDERCWGLIFRSEQELIDVENKIKLHLEGQKEYVHKSVMHIEDESGEYFNPDAVVEVIIMTLSSSLQMLGYNEGLFAGSDLVLPNPTSAEDDVIFKAGATQFLAFCWQKLKETEELIRYFGGKAISISKERFPKEWDGLGIKEALYLKKENIAWEMVDFVANERTKRYVSQSATEMRLQYKLKDVIVDLADVKGIIDKKFISEEEAVCCVTLSEFLCFDVISDKNEYGGLTVREWIRGYSILKCLSIGKSTTADGTFRYLLSRPSLVGTLVQGGLSDNKANFFIDHIIFGKDSRDLFDCPVLRLSNGQLYIFVPSGRCINIFAVVMSKISSIGLSIKGKGQHFEQNIVSFLTSQRLNCKAFAFKREEEQYEYDAVLVWDKYVFVLECKNYSLSNNNPVASYYFSQKIESATRQVQRLVSGLKTFPEVFKEHFFGDITSYKIVPVILNSFPFSFPGDIHGVFLSDASALRRFFKSPAITVNISASSSKGFISCPIPTHRLWKGDTPTPEDFIECLTNPIQYQSIHKHLKTELVPFRVTDDKVFICERVIYSEIPEEANLKDIDKSVLSAAKTAVDQAKR